MSKDEKKPTGGNGRSTRKPGDTGDLDNLHRLAKFYTSGGRHPSRRKELEALVVDDSTSGLLQAMEYFGSGEPGASQRPGLEKGKVVEGTVTEVQDCSVFVDLGGGATGLVHVSDLSWALIKHPSDVVQVGQRVRVEILDNPPNSRVIHLGLKHTTADPWDTTEERFPVGSRVDAVVNHVNRNGAWFTVAPGIEGMMGAGLFEKVSPEMDHQEVFPVGKKVTMTVAGVMPSIRQIALTWEPATGSAGAAGSQDGDA